METRDVTVTLPATAQKRWGSDGKAYWIVTVLGAVGKDTSLSGARQRARESVTELLMHAGAHPAFALDDDGAFVVAVAVGASTDVYRICQDGRMSLYTTHGTPQEAIARVPHYRPLSR